MANREVVRVVRPTFRCLIEDLAAEILPIEFRYALRTVMNDLANDPTYLLPCALVDVEHPVVVKANLIAIDPSAMRERIEMFRARRVIKVKTGDRRAALWQDEGGIWWLLASGRRKNDSTGDFYRNLERFSDDFDPMAPQDVDYNYHRMERAYRYEVELESSVRVMVLDALRTAARLLGSEVGVEAFGAQVAIRIVPDADELAVLEISWKFDNYEEQDRFPTDLLAMVPGQQDVTNWEYLPPPKGRQGPVTWFSYVTKVWVAEMAVGDS